MARLTASIAASLRLYTVHCSDHTKTLALAIAHAMLASVAARCEKTFGRTLGMSGRSFKIALALSLSLSAAPAATAQNAPVGFRTPSKNIACQFFILDG